MALLAGAWSESCLITITKKGGSNVEFAALTETVDIDMGDKDIEAIATISGGRLIKKIPQEVTTITFEGYPVDIDSAGGTGVAQMFEGGTWDTSEPLQADASRSRDLFRVAILWTDDPAATSAAGATAAGTNSYRIYFEDCYMVSMKPSFTDGVLKVTFSFKCAPFDKSGNAKIHEQSGDATALTALSAY